MPPFTKISEVSPLTDFNCFAKHCALRKESFELLTLSKIEGSLPTLPRQFLPPTYALEFVVNGYIRGKINNRFVELKPNYGVMWLTDHVLEDVEVSPDCEIYVMGFTSQFAEDLNIKIPQSHLSYIFMHPVWQMEDEKMQIVLRYMDFMQILIEQNNYSAVLNMVRSLMYFLAEDLAVNLQHTHSQTRVEQICGQYLSLVETHCYEHHTVEWYASQMCLSPKYISNVVKQTLGSSPNKCIDRALIRKSKSLLSSTSLSVQQIANRLGFQNQSHFGTFFKRKTGCSPAAFRKKKE